jgi:hypothetical protein
MFQVLFMLAWIPFREPDAGTVLTLISRGSAWTGAQSGAAALWMAGIIAFSWIEDALERSFPRMVRWLVWLPEPAFAFGYSVVFLCILSGVRHETMFIYQRF